MCKLFKLFKRNNTRVTPVLVVTGKIKYNELTEKYAFWPNYAKGNGLKQQYDLGHLVKHPCKFPNATSIGFFDTRYGTLIAFSNGSDGIALDAIIKR